MLSDHSIILLNLISINVVQYLVFRDPLVINFGKGQFYFGSCGSIPVGYDFFFNILICTFVTFFSLVLSLLSLNFCQTVRHSPRERSHDITLDNPRGYFVAWWEHLRGICMRIGKCCFASEFPYCGHPIVWRLVWESIGSWSMQTKCPGGN